MQDEGLHEIQLSGKQLVFLFMAVYYRGGGLIADAALLANVLLVLGAFAAFGFTLTLPGIAGIVLTVGMAVDSNVIIYERVREERRLGRSLVQSLDSGFARALATIVDANFTTFIAAVILFFLGSGPVRGFAVTLAIGIITTVFTAFTLTRWMIALWLRKAKPKELPNGLVRLVPDDTNDALDVFVCDRVEGRTRRVSLGPSDRQGNEDSEGAVISADGRSIAFGSTASNLVPGDTNGAADTFVRTLVP